VFQKIIFYVASSGIGTFVCNVLEKTPMNVWSARGIGCVVAVMVALLLYNFWLKKELTEEVVSVTASVNSEMNENKEE